MVWCDECDRWFPHVQAITQHFKDSRAHTGLWCALCNVTFVDGLAISNHLRDAAVHRKPTLVTTQAPVKTVDCKKPAAPLPSVQAIPLPSVSTNLLPSVPATQLPSVSTNPLPPVPATQLPSVLTTPLSSAPSIKLNTDLGNKACLVHIPRAMEDKGTQTNNPEEKRNEAFEIISKWAVAARENSSGSPNKLKDGFPKNENAKETESSKRTHAHEQSSQNPSMPAQPVEIEWPSTQGLPSPRMQIRSSSQPSPLGHGSSLSSGTTLNASSIIEALKSALFDPGSSPQKHARPQCHSCGTAPVGQSLEQWLNAATLQRFTRNESVTSQETSNEELCAEIDAISATDPSTVSESSEDAWIVLPCWASCGRKFSSVAKLLLHFEKGICSSNVGIEEIHHTAVACQSCHAFVHGRYIIDLEKGRDLAEKYKGNAFPFICPGEDCESVFREMSGLLEHAEKTECNPWEQLAASGLREFLDNLRYRLAHGIL